MQQNLGNANDIITFDNVFEKQLKKTIYTYLLEKDFTCLDNTIERTMRYFTKPNISGLDFLLSHKVLFLLEHF